MQLRLRPEVLEPRDGLARVASPRTAVVVGGGLAGVAAAVVLAERGVAVTLVEKERVLGGRVSAWTDTLATGETFEMERGFHAFFRQYYNLRALLGRLDPSLSFLMPLEDYPILGPHGAREKFSGIPNVPLLNIALVALRSGTLGLRDLPRIDAKSALAMLAFDSVRTYDSHDDTTAGEYLDGLRFPRAARQMLFDVFAHSFFNPEDDMSAAELLMMFHFYFIGNPEGLVFDVLREPFSTAVWGPMRTLLDSLGVEVLLGTSVARIEQHDERFRVVADGAGLEADGCVLALDVAGLERVLTGSPGLGDEAWRANVGSLSLTLPFAVWRLFLDRPLARDRVPFAGTTGVGMLDNISLYHLFEGESRAWAARTGGAVVELHAYAVPLDATEAAIRADLQRGLYAFYPEAARARVIEDRFLLRRDCPAFAPGSHAARPGVETPVPGLALAGDFVRVPIPTALMERAVTTGMLAANTLLDRWHVRGETLRCVPRRGIFAPRR